MKIIKLDIESDILNKNVYLIKALENIDEFIREEPFIKNNLNPYYIQCSVPANQLNLIHMLENQGFRFVEFRLRKQLDTIFFKPVSDYVFYPYYIKLISDNKGLNQAQQLVIETYSDDRFSLDPKIDKELSEKRLLFYLKKSFDKFPDEFVYGLFNKNNEELLCIKTGGLNKFKELTFFQTYHKKSIEIEKFTYMIDSLVISQYLNEGIQNFYAISSGLNILELDLHISDLKYKIDTATILLRKIYE